MCGIAGVFGTRAPEIVQKMLRVLAHRGPDEQYCVPGEDFTLGARRLAILDLPGGQQPLCTPDRRFWGCQNGEIYNFVELREQLLQRGHSLRTRGDTEVIPHLYQDRGPDCVHDLHGMFALAVWDRQSRQGMLARDRAGKKPLYYTVHEGSLWFASEIKALLQLPGFVRRPRAEATYHYLSLKNVPAPLTAFEEIFILPPGHRLLWAAGQLRVERYWRLDWTPLEGELREEELAEELLVHLQAAVKRRLVADVPVAFFLSGGLDSSLCTALGAACSPGVRTFTLRYRPDSSTPGKELDLACAREIAARYQTEHHEEELDFSRFQEELPAILTHFDEPFSGVMSTYFLSRLIARHVKVALSGDGADELFGSYLSHRMAEPLALFNAGKRTGLGHFQEQPEFLSRFAGLSESGWRGRLFVWTEEEKQELYCRPPGYSTQDWLNSVYAGLSARDPLNRVLEAEWQFQLPDQVLTFADRLSMAHSLELRSPFLDTQVMEYAARIPARFKIRGGDVKRVLKTAARRYLPATAIDRPKEGFLMPINQWLGGWLLPFARETLAPDRLARHGLFRPEPIAGLLDKLAAGDTTPGPKILSLLCWQLWFDMYLHAPVSLPRGDGALVQFREAQTA